MKYYLTLISLIFLLNCTTQSNKTSENTDERRYIKESICDTCKGKDLSINFMLRGYLYAKSSTKDTNAPGGFGGSDNKQIPNQGKFEIKTKDLVLFIEDKNLIKIQHGFLGYKLFLINNTDSTVLLSAADSRLEIIAEVFHENEWKPIEYLIGSTCGNSYHTVSLEKNNYWEFEVYKFNGDIKTKLRYRLMRYKQNDIYSNEISTSINKGQLSVKKQYYPGGPMDPYEE